MAFAARTGGSMRAGPAYLILFLVFLCTSACHAQNVHADRGLVGSAACRDCHEAIYDRWSRTRMANILVDVNDRPEVVVGDFSTPNEFVTFDRDDVDFTYGSKWKQRYFTRVGDDYFVLPAQWDVVNRVWRNYNPMNEWWVDHYPADQMQRPSGPLCDGCHSVDYDIQTKTVSEWNVGCEKCHGPGAAHAENPEFDNIVNPARLDHVEGNDVCIQCHSQGQPPGNPIGGLYFDWPVGYVAGDRLADYWHLEEHRLGEETSTHFPEGSAHKNRMQGNDFVQSAMYTKSVSCWSCHDVHGTDNNADLIKPAQSLCLTCHGPESPAGPRGNSLEQHTQHSEDKGVECVDCHMPQIARTIADINVRSHTFRFISPSDTEKYGIPNPCTSCHVEPLNNVPMTNEEAAGYLINWGHVSPWRVSR
jgi:predicted CXXCH cytochrome family protein